MSGKSLLPDLCISAAIMNTTLNTNKLLKQQCPNSESLGKFSLHTYGQY